MIRTHIQKHQQPRQGRPGNPAQPGAAARRQVHSILHEAALQRKCACGGSCPECQKQAPPIVDEVLRSSGQPLDPGTRDFMELRFGHDFARVKVHTDSRAAESAQAVDARAYTVGQDIAFGPGQYAPRTLEGRRLLAHELTHVIHQTGGSQGAPALQRAVVTSGCDQLPYDKKKVEDAAQRVYKHVESSGCIENESLREDLLKKLGSLKINCKPGGNEGPCGRADGSRTINLYEAVNKPNLCPTIDAAIFHEAVHLTESLSLSHGTLSWDCGEACYPGTDQLKRGDASKCGLERDALPLVGLSAGRAFSGKGSSANYFRLYAGMEKRRLIFSFVDGSLGIGASLIGEPVSGEPGTAPSGKSGLISLMGALRFDTGKAGAHYFSVSGGLGLALGNDKEKLGAVVGVGAGYRWRVLDVSLNAGIDYNPTRNLGEEKMYTLSASFSLAQKVRPPNRR